MRVAKATELFSKDDFSEDEDWDLNPQSIYHCPNCGGELAFCMRDFKRHQSSAFTNLRPEDVVEVERAADSVVDSDSYLDFYCPGCQAPTRIYYRFWAGGRYTSGFRIEYAVVGNGA